MRSLLLTALALACATSLPLGEPFKIQRGQTVAVNGATVTFEAVHEDSRCAPNVICVWEGNAAIDVRVNGTALVLHTHGGDNYPRSASVADYVIELRELSRVEPHVATVVVTKR